MASNLSYPNRNTPNFQLITRRIFPYFQYTHSPTLYTLNSGISWQQQCTLQGLIAHNEERMPHSFGSTRPKHYLSVKSSSGNALDAKAVKGCAGAGAPGGCRGTGGGGGLLVGNTQKATSVPGVQSSPKLTLEPEDELGWWPRESGPVGLDLPPTPKSSSSSKVTQPLGLLTLTAGGPFGSKLSLKPSSDDAGLISPRGFREGKGLWATGCSWENHEVASDSWDPALKGFPGAAVLSVKGFVPLELVTNGFGEQRVFSWDLLRAGIGGIVGMQLAELKVFVLPGVAQGNGINPSGSGVWTGNWSFNTVSRFNDRSSNGSLFNGESSLTAETPFVFTWKREHWIIRKKPKSILFTLNTPYASCLNYFSWRGARIQI